MNCGISRVFWSLLSLERNLLFDGWGNEEYEKYKNNSVNVKSPCEKECSFGECAIGQNQ